MTDNIFVFDRNSIRQKRNRCAPTLEKHGFLVDWSMDQISTRLEDVKRTFPTCLQIGCRTPDINKDRFGIETLYTLDIAEKLSPDIQADEELLPFAANSFDLIISPLNLHTTNDLPGTLAQINHALKPDGLFIAALLGGETLHELRHIMQLVEMEQTGGVSPRVAPFADMPQMGALMQRAGFNLPVIDSEIVTVTYNHPFELMQDLRRMGESNSIRDRRKNFTSMKLMKDIADQYSENFSEEDGRIYATFEIIFLIGWKPHHSQQKPLRPGSAIKRLSDALKTKEKKLPW